MRRAPGSARPARERGHRAANRADALSAVGQGEDRKSTRLNSSHLVISYAVFCLKKKKKPLQKHIHSRALSHIKYQHYRTNVPPSMQPLSCSFRMITDGRTLKVRIKIAIAMSLNH